MALRILDLECLIPLVKKSKIKPFEIFSLGHPDILVNKEELKGLVKNKDWAVNNSQVIDERIGNSPEECLGSAFELFEWFGGCLTAMEIRDGLFGISSGLDLNYKIHESHYDRYMMVIDPGTLEHVCNVGQGLENVIKILKVGGWVYHVSPMTMVNHGYWNFCPTMYWDFYRENGFEIIKLMGQGKKPKNQFVVPAQRKFTDLSMNAMLVCLAQKTKEIEAIKWPMQEKYR